MLLQDKIQSLISQIESHNDDPTWLSNCALELSVLLYNLGEEASQARLVQEQATLRYLDVIPTDGTKKMAVSEAQTRGLTDTSNQYERLDTGYKSILEIIMTIKKKLDLAGSQMRSGV